MVLSESLESIHKSPTDIAVGGVGPSATNVLALEAGSYPEENVAFPSIDSLLPEIRFAEIKFDVIVINKEIHCNSKAN